MFEPSTSCRSRAWVEVDLDRLRRNADAIAAAVGPATRLVPMVKADAYGLGIGEVVDALASASGPAAPWAFGVATLTEGETLRAHGWTGRVLVFSPPYSQDLPRAAAADLTLGLSDVGSVHRLAEVAAALGRRLPFHLEVDTGMGRAGLLWSEAPRWGGEVARAAAEWLDWEGTYTHFHSADEPDLAPTDLQWSRFQGALTALAGRLGEPHLIHVANSAASLRRAGFGCDLARPGIYLYGGRAGPGYEPLPVASVRARLVLVKDVPVGATVGYGATYTAKRPARWGTLAIGYGDGLPRALAPGGGFAIVRGQRVPLIGRISMDVSTVDLSDVPDAELGDVATLIGEADGVSIPVDEVAARAGTISYEILTGLTGRLPRVYLERGGEQRDP